MRHLQGHLRARVDPWDGIFGLGDPMRLLTLVLAALFTTALLAGNASAVTVHPGHDGYCIGVSTEGPWGEECLGVSEHCIGYSYDPGRWYPEYCVFGIPYNYGLA